MTAFQNVDMSTSLQYSDLPKRHRVEYRHVYIWTMCRISNYGRDWQPLLSAAGTIKVVSRAFYLMSELSAMHDVNWDGRREEFDAIAVGCCSSRLDAPRGHHQVLNRPTCAAGPEPA